MPECPSCNTRVAFGAACCTTCGASLPRTNPAPKNAPIYGEKKLIVVNLESVVDMSPAHRIARRQKKKGKAAKKVLRDYMNTFKARPNAKDFLSRLSQRQGALVAFVSDFPESDKSKVADMLRSLALPLSHDDSGVLVFMGSDKAALNRYSSTYTITHYFGPGFRDARKMMVPAAYSSVEDYIGAPANPYLAPPASPGPYALSGLRPEPTPGSYTLTNPTGKKNCGCGQDPCITYGPQPNPSLDFTRKAIENEEAADSKIEQLKKENEEILALIEELDMEIEKAQFEGKSTVDLQLDKGELVVAHEENLTDISKLQRAMKLSQSSRPEYLRANPPVKPRRQTNKKTGKKRKESAKNYFQRLVSNKKMNEEFPRNDQRVAVSLSYVEKEYGKRGADSVTKTWGTKKNPTKGAPVMRLSDGKMYELVETISADVGDGDTASIFVLKGKKDGSTEYITELSLKQDYAFDYDHRAGPSVYANPSSEGRPTRESVKKRLKELVKDYETVILSSLGGELPLGGWEDVEDAVFYDLHEMFGWGAELVPPTPFSRKNPPSTKKMDKAKKAYKDFNGKDPKEVRTEKVDFGGMLVYLGDCWSIGYRNGKEGFGDDQKYIHEFGVDEETGRTFEEPKLYMTVPDQGKPMLVIKDGAWKIKTDKNGVSWIYY